MQIELREARWLFSRIMQALRAGEEVVLTERGKPLARIIPVRQDQMETVLGRLEAEGFLRAAAKPGPMPPFKPRRIRGVPITQTLREERESS